jgi:X-Pro dipeptidyl-peptidase
MKTMRTGAPGSASALQTGMRSTKHLLVCAAALLALRPAWAPAQEFVDGLAQPVFAGQPIVSHNVWVEIPGLDSDRDGVDDRIRTQVRRPAATQSGTRLPVVMIASPYSGGTLPFPQYDITGPLYVPPPHGAGRQSPPALPPIGHVPPNYGNTAPFPNIATSGYQNYFLPRGFIFVYAQSLGTGLSTGCPTIGGYEESLAMKAVIDWLNGRGTGFDESGNVVTAYWTTGNTAMIGTSYDGTLPLAAASTGVRGLKAIVPVAGVSSYYDHRRSYGTVINSNPTIGTDADTLFDNILTRRQPEACAFMREQITFGMDRTTGDYNKWWDERNYRNYVRRFNTAVLISHGLNDLNTKPRMYARLYAELQKHHVPAKIWLNQGGHGDGANSGARQAAWRDELNRFWSQYLFGIDNHWEEGARAAIQRENSQWLDYQNWPVPGAKTTTFEFTAALDNTVGGLQLESPHHHGRKSDRHHDQDDSWDRCRDRDDDSGRDHGDSHHGPYLPARELETLVDDSSLDANVLIAAAQSQHRLVYQTAPLTSMVHMSGIPWVSLELRFDQPAAVVSAAVVDYRADGTVRLVTRGSADPQNYQSIWRTRRITPGKEYEINFELQPHDYQFQPGSRIGVVVMSTDRLFTLRPPPGTQLSLNTAASNAFLPIVGGAPALSAALQ